MKKLIPIVLFQIIGLSFLFAGIAAAQTLPDLIVTSIDAPASASTQETISINWTVKNEGSGQAVVDWLDGVYLSADEQFDPSVDTALRNTWHNGGLSAGADYPAAESVQIPGVLPGRYYILVKADFWGNKCYESNEENNVLSRQINIGVPDLVVSAITAPATASTQETISISWTVKNEGSGAAVVDWLDGVYLSTDAQLDTLVDTNIISTWHNGALAAGADYTATQSVQIPAVPPGNYYILVKADYWDYWGNVCYESNEENNVLSRQISIDVPDLIVTAIDAPAQASTQEQITISWSVTNQGMA